MRQRTGISAPGARCRARRRQSSTLHRRIPAHEKCGQASPPADSDPRSSGQGSVLHTPWQVSSRAEEQLGATSLRSPPRVAQAWSQAGEARIAARACTHDAARRPNLVLPRTPHGSRRLPVAALPRSRRTLRGLQCPTRTPRCPTWRLDPSTDRAAPSQRCAQRQRASERTPAPLDYVAEQSEPQPYHRSNVHVHLHAADVRRYGHCATHARTHYKPNTHPLNAIGFSAPRQI